MQEIPGRIADNLRFIATFSGTFAVMTRLRSLVTASSVAVLGSLTLAVGASAASTTVKVKVTGLKGGSVLAVDSAGLAVRAKVRSGTVSLRVPRNKVSGTSLHLTDASGRYRGPVVLASKGSKAYVTLGKGARRSSVSLGTAKVRSGYAVLSRKASSKLLLTSAYAKASRGVPIGAGRLGLQKASPQASARARGAQGSSQTIPGGTDPDRDSLPSNIDVDDNGNGILDNQDSSQTPTSDGIFASMNLRPSDSGINVNATGVTDAQIDANLTADSGFSVTFYLSLAPDQGTVTGGWVDCGALSYCNYETGTALIGGLSESSSDLPRGTPWRNYRPDGNPQGNGLEELANPNWRPFAMSIIPKATSAQLSPGDIYNVNLSLAGRVVVNTIALPSYPVTVPAVKTVTSGGTSTTLSYGDPNAPGTNDGTAIQLSPAGDLSMDYWRPQRRGVPGAGEQPFMDMGRLHYTVTVGALRVPDGGSGSLRNVPPQREFSCDASGNAVFPEGAGGESFFGPADSADDSAPNPANTRTYATNLRSCIEQAIAAGAFPSLSSIPAGTVVNAAFTAAGEQRRGGADRAVLSIAFKF